MLIRWKSKDKSSSSSNQNANTNSGSSSSSSSKKKRKGREGEEDWQNENKSGRGMQSNEQGDERRRGMRREDPRRHTLGGDMLIYGNNQIQSQQRAQDLEGQMMRAYVPINQGPLFDDDPGIMSEVETASTGFRRGGKQRSSLPVVRTPSKTLERPLGLVFLQYRSETKRALLPNEITSIDTVRALFVRSFPRQLTMAYLEGPNVKIYIHDASKDMFYELEDVRSHLREIRDRSVLRLFESTEVAAPPQILPGGPGIPQPLPQVIQPHWDQDQSYFSEPEFESEYKHQHIHKSKIGKQAPAPSAAPYYVGASQTLPRGMYSDRNKVSVGAPVKPLRTHGSRGSMDPLFPYSPDQLYSIPDGYSSSPERNSRGNYEEPYYSQYGTRGTVVAPVIDEEQSEVGMADDQYSLYGMKVVPGRMPRTNQIYDPTRPEDLHRMRVEHMERQLANLTGLVQKALVNQNPQIAPIPVPTVDNNYLVVPNQCQANGSMDDMYTREKAPKLGKHACQKSVSFEKSVSFSDDIQGIPKSHNPQHAADTKPTKPAIKSSTLPRTSSQERDRLKPPPPPKPLVLAQTTHPSYRADIALAPEVYNHLRSLQKKAKDLRMEVRTLRRLSQAQAVAVREDIKSTFMRIRATLLASSGGGNWGFQGDQDTTRITREEELYKQEVIRLEKDLSDLEGSVESLRGEVINRRTRVNMTAVEDMALVLSRASKTVAELKMKFPALSNGLRCILSSEMEKVVREEKFLKEEPDRLESALRRCKKLTGTLVTLKRLASVQEQRLPPNDTTQGGEDGPRSATDASTGDKPIPTPRMGTFAVGGSGGNSSANGGQQPPENALDALLDELQTFSKPLTQNSEQTRNDDSISEDNSMAISSTVTTQISQAMLYTHNEATAAGATAATGAAVNQLPQSLQQQLTVDASSTTTTVIATNRTTSKHLLPHSNMGSLRRLASYPSGSDTDVSPPLPSGGGGGGDSGQRPAKPPVPERSSELISKVNSNKRIPPPPPPRTSSRSPLASPTSPNVPASALGAVAANGSASIPENSAMDCNSDNSSGNESGNDQVQRQVALEMRHQELLKKQKQLQEQYHRLQQLSKISAVEISAAAASGGPSDGPGDSEKPGPPAAVTNATNNVNEMVNKLNNQLAENSKTDMVNNTINSHTNDKDGAGTGTGTTTTKQLYETEIL